MKKAVAYFIVLFSAALFLTLSLLSFRNAEGFNPFLMDSSIGKSAPDFALKDLSGNDVDLSSFKGRPVLLNFWATWCGYCRRERTHLNALYEEFKEKGLVIIAVSTDRSVKKVQKYMKKIPSEFIVLSDLNGDVAALYRITGLPTSFLIDREGVITNKFMGYREWSSSRTKELIDAFIEQ